MSQQPAWLIFHEAGVFCTYPQAFLTKTSQFFSEFITATILMFVIFALKDESNRGAMGKTGAGPFFSLALFFLIFGLGACFGFETGYAINLARDFGPRLMSYAVGYGHEVWSAGAYYFWSKCISGEFPPIGYRDLTYGTYSSGGRYVCIVIERMLTALQFQWLLRSLGAPLADFSMIYSFTLDPKARSTRRGWGSSD